MAVVISTMESKAKFLIVKEDMVLDHIPASSSANIKISVYTIGVFHSFAPLLLLRMRDSNITDILFSRVISAILLS